MSQSSFSQKDITDFVSGLVTLCGSNIIDDEGYICNPTDTDLPPVEEDRCQYKVNDEVKYLVPYADNINKTNVVIINPFAEGITDSFEKNWFYSTRGVIASLCIMRVMRFVIEKSIIAKTNKKAGFDKDIIKLISPYINDVDEKMFDEFNLLIDKTVSTDFFSIFYAKSTRTAKCCVGLLDQSYLDRPEFKSIRKKSWATFRKILLGIFSEDPSDPISNFDEFSWTSKSKACPNLDAYLNVLYKVLATIERPLALSGKIINLSVFNHMPHIDAYHEKAKWLTQPTALTSPTKAGKGKAGIIEPWTPPTQNAYGPMINQQPQFLAPGQSRQMMGNMYQAPQPQFVAPGGMMQMHSQIMNQGMVNPIGGLPYQPPVQYQQPPFYQQPQYPQYQQPMNPLGGLPYVAPQAYGPQMMNIPGQQFDLSNQETVTSPLLR